MRLIDADALKENAREWLPEIAAHKSPFVVMGLFNLIDNLADNMPTVDPVKKGHWIKSVDPEYDGDATYFAGPCFCTCSNCGHTRRIETRFCCECGARMEGAQ